MTQNNNVISSFELPSLTNLNIFKSFSNNENDTKGVINGINRKESILVAKQCYRFNLPKYKEVNKIIFTWIHPKIKEDYYLTEMNQRNIIKGLIKSGTIPKHHFKAWPFQSVHIHTQVSKNSVRLGTFEFEQKLQIMPVGCIVEIVGEV